MSVHKKGSLPEAVSGVVSLMNLMADHGLHFDQVLGFVERRLVDVFVEVDNFLSVYCVDAATTVLDFPTYLLAYSDFVSVDPRPAISVPHVLPVNIRFLRVGMLCVRQMLMALRSGHNFSISQQIFDCAIGVDGEGEYRLVKPDRNPGYKLAGFDDSVQWCFGAYSLVALPFLTPSGNYYSPPSYVTIAPNNLWVSEQAAKDIALSLEKPTAENLPVIDVLNSLLPVATAEVAVIEVVRHSGSSSEPDKLLSMNELIEVISFSRSKINNLRNPENERHDPTFPKPVDTGSTALRWRESDINEWISSRKLKA